MLKCDSHWVRQTPAGTAELNQHIVSQPLSSDSSSSLRSSNASPAARVADVHHNDGVSAFKGSCYNYTVQHNMETQHGNTTCARTSSICNKYASTRFPWLPLFPAVSASVSDDEGLSADKLGIQGFIKVMSRAVEVQSVEITVRYICNFHSETRCLIFMRELQKLTNDFGSA